LDRSPENHTGHDEQPEQGVASKGKTRVKEEREIKEDGRYLIYYDFEDEGERESLKS